MEQYPTRKILNSSILKNLYLGTAVATEKIGFYVTACSLDKDVSYTDVDAK